MTAPPDATTSRGTRILGVDAARCLALVGMFATHILPLEARDGSPTLTGLLADGRSSALFAVLAGVGVALSTGGALRPPDATAHAVAAAALLVRGVLVGALGLCLVGLDPPVFVILAYYGLLFVVAIPLLRLPAWALAAGAALMCVLGPVLSHLLRSGLLPGPPWPPQPGLGALAEPGQLLTLLGLTGVYPVLPWTTYLLAGMAIGRLDLRRIRSGGMLLAGGAVLAVLANVVSAVLLGQFGGLAVLGRRALGERAYGSTPTGTWWWLATDAPHSGTPLDLAHTTGTAVAVLGAMLLLAHWSRALVWLPAALGGVPLTVYTLHVVALSAYAVRGSTALLLTHVVVALLIGAILRAAGQRGPLEAVLAVASRGARRLAGGRVAR